MYYHRDRCSWTMWLKLYELYHKDGISHAEEQEILEAMKDWTDAVTVITEDGHKKVECPKCEALEHVDVVYQFGQCMLCELEN